MIEVATDDSGQKTGLNVGNEREGGRLAGDRVGQTRLLSLLVGDEDGFSGLGIHRDTSHLIVDKPLWRNLPPIDHREHQTIRERGTKLFHEIESERGSSWPIDVEVAHARVEAHSG